MNNRLPSNHMVKVLNLKNLEKEVATFLLGNGYEMNGARITAQFAPIGLVVDMTGRHYLINHEGCGSGVSLESEKDKIGWCKDTYDEKGNLTSIGCYPIVESSLDLVDVLSIPVEKEVRLDEFIRVFGDRLDSNCVTWDKLLSGRLAAKG